MAKTELKITDKSNGQDLSSAPLRSVEQYESDKGGSGDFQIGTKALRFLMGTEADKVRPVYDRLVKALGGVESGVARAALLSAASAFTFDALVAGANVAKTARYTRSDTLPASQEEILKAWAKAHGQEAADNLRKTMLEARQCARDAGVRLRKSKIDGDIIVERGAIEPKPTTKRKAS